MTENQPVVSVAEEKAANNLMHFFMILYLAEGWAQVSGILHQPLYYFCKEVLGWQANAVGAYIAVLGMPWVIKPVYGLISDAFPLFGYRRKSYLILLMLASCLACWMIPFFPTPAPVLWCLMVITVGMAASSALGGGLLVETGKNTGHNTRFCSQQTLWVNIANITAALIGGWLCSHFAASESLKVGAFITGFAPLCVVLATVALVKEERSKLGASQFKAVWKGTTDALSSGTLWLLAAFLVLWAFNPGFGTPLYFHMADKLHFSQVFIGSLGAWFAGGAAVGALLFRWLSPKVPLNLSVMILVVLGAIVQYAFVFLGSETSAIALNIANGVITAAAGLAVHVVAANKCPKGAEGFVYGGLLALTNLSYFGSQALGGELYVTYMHKDINALIGLSACLTLSCLVVLPFVNFAKEGGPTWFAVALKRITKIQSQDLQ